MPVPHIQSLADKGGVSLKRAEELWRKAKGIVKKQYPSVPEDGDNFYALVTGVVKKMLKLSEDEGGSMASITTTTAGDVSVVGGSGNFATYLGRSSRVLPNDKKKKKKKKKITEKIRFKGFYLYEGQDKKLYVDMDGVLTDFPKQFEKYMGVHPDKAYAEMPEEEIWKQIRTKGGEKYWSEMEWMPDGKKLWNYVKRFNPTILSTPANFKESETGKHKWIKREIGNVPAIIIRKKEKYADENSVLIDDLTKKINRWKASNGIGILHKSANESIKQLKKLGF